MNEELLLERAKMTHDVSEALRKAGWTYTQQISATTMTFEVVHPDLPGWNKLVVIDQWHRDRVTEVNVLKIPGAYRSEQMTKASIQRMMAKLDSIKTTVLMIRSRNAEFADATAKFGKQQELELGSVKLPEWMSVSVRISGDHIGRYQVNFEPGSPMERLSAGQVTRLAEVMRDFETSDAAEDANHSI